MLDTGVFRLRHTRLRVKVNDRRVCSRNACGGTKARQVATASRLNKAMRNERDRPDARGELDLYTYHRKKGEKISALHIVGQKQGLVHMHATRRRQLKAVPVGPSRQGRILSGLFLHRAERNLALGILSCAGTVAFGLLPTEIPAALLGAPETG